MSDAHSMEKKYDLTHVEVTEDEKKPSPRKYEFVWKSAIIIPLLHVLCVYGVYLMFTSAHIKTTLLAGLLYLLGGMGMTAGVHRLWSHRSYKARPPLQWFLMLCNTIAFQGKIIQWARDHRMHHKYSDTDADPHNSRRGFFFSHVGWLMVRKHPAIKAKAHNVDMSDLQSIPALQFQEKYYFAILMPVLAFIGPTLMPMYFWNETLLNAFTVNISRFIIALNVVFCVNSVAHMFGNKPYDKNMNPAENLFVSVFVWGEGWHNYHHTFPWDYRTSEWGNINANLTTFFIDMMAKLGLAYDLKSASPDMIQKRVQRTGDGSHAVWGWGDKDQTAEDKKVTVITYKETLA